jgi:hypothetical protein
MECTVNNNHSNDNSRKIYLDTQSREALHLFLFHSLRSSSKRDDFQGRQTKRIVIDRELYTFLYDGTQFMNQLLHTGSSQHAGTLVTRKD